MKINIAIINLFVVSFMSVVNFSCEKETTNKPVEEIHQTLFKIPSDFLSISDCIDQTQYGDTILIESGNYDEDVSVASTKLFVASTFLYDKDTDIIKKTILKRWVIDRSVVTFLGVTIQHAMAPSSIDDHDLTYGGGLKISTSRVLIDNCIIDACSAFKANVTGEGGGIYAISSILEINQTKITNCFSASQGAMSFSGFSLLMDSCYIAYNEASMSSGGMLVTSPDFIIKNTRFETNIGPTDFGYDPCHYFYGTGKLENCIFINDSICIDDNVTVSNLQFLKDK